MGAAMKQRKPADDRDASRQRQPSRGGDEESKHQDRRDQRGFEEWNGNRDQRKTSKTHRADECRGQKPNGAAAKLHRPKAHREHRQQMVESGERMDESLCEIAGRCVPRMPVRESRREEMENAQQDGDSERKSGFHWMDKKVEGDLNLRHSQLGERTVFSESEHP